jgi:hypothetical protein
MSIDHSPKRPFWKKGKLRDGGKVDLERNRLLQLARKLKLDDQIVIEAPGNTNSIVRLLSPFVGRVVVANPILVRALIRCRSRVKGAEFPEATTRPAQGVSSYSKLEFSVSPQLQISQILIRPTMGPGAFKRRRGPASLAKHSVI